VTPTALPSRPGPARPRPERGAGLISTVFGVAFLMAMLGVTINVALGLWERSTVDAVAYDAAMRAATAPAGADRAAVRAEAITRARELLGRHSGDVQLDFVDDPAAPDDVVLRVQSPGVSLLPRFLASGPIVAGLDRRIVVRREAR